ncbi:MAG: hypothetical protein JW871_01565 [Endomicrobiales bacterium]|nr:hypothetical protein [Endomicrobiales bacterium]
MNSFFKFLPAVLIIISSTVQANAHPPKAMDIEFDNESRMINLTLKHNVRDNKEHFINKVQVYVDGNLAVIQNFGSQTDKKCQKISYILVDAEIGSEIKIISACSMGGNLTRTFTVKESKKPQTKK